jgi:hypothetical protein
MINEKLLGLLKALQRGTSVGHVPWQDLPEDEMFLAQIGPGIVRVGKFSIGDRKGYTLWVFGVGGVIVAELEVFEGDPNFHLIEDIYASARLWVRDGEQLIDRMITQLTLA